MENGLNKRKKYSDFICMLPACVFVLSIIIVRLRLFSMPMTNVYWSEATNESTLSDLFSYWKAITIIGAACLAAVVLIIAYFKEQIHFKKAFFYIPALVYCIFVFISLIFSDYKYFALRGMGEHFEGAVVLFAYIGMVAFLANAVDSENRLKIVVSCALGASVLIGILGVTQAVGHDFFSTAIGQKMMTPNYTLDSGVKSWDMIDILTASGQKAYDFSFTEGEVYQTVYNINYVPLYLSSLVPLAAFVFLFVSKGDSKGKLVLSTFSLLVYGLLLFNYFAANSASGYIGLIIIFIAAILVFHKHLRAFLKPLLCLLVVSGLIISLTADRWLPEIKKGLGDITKITTSYVYADDIEIKTEYENAPESKGPFLDYVESLGDHLDFSMEGNVLRITRDIVNSGYELSDGEGNPLYISTIENDSDPGWYQVLDDRFHDYIRVGLKTIGENTYFVVHVWGNEWPFRHNGENFVLRNVVGKETTICKVPHAELFDYTFGSQRGLIWDTTLPMLKNYLFKGSGPDTFVFAYPQNDYVTLSNYFGHSMRNRVTDKAHNLYLQYWINTGLISLLAWLTMVGYYLVGAVKQFRKRGFVDFCDFVNGGIFCGILGFLAVAFFNDGSVNTMPMFYTMLGTGLAINMRDKWPEANSGEVEAKDRKNSPEAMPEV